MVKRTQTTFAAGRRGDLFVKVRNGERLPCLMDMFWMGGNVYHQDCYYSPDESKRAEYVDAIRQGRVVMAKYEKEPGQPYKRVGYIEGRVFKVNDVRNVEGHGLSCRIVGSEMA